MQHGNECPIWGTPATVYPAAEEWVVVDSPRAGGRYRLPIGYSVGSQRVQELVRARLTTWLVDQRRMGDANPYADHNVILGAGRASPMRTFTKMDRFFLALASVDFDALENFTVAGLNDEAFWKWTYLFGAWTEDSRPGGGLAVVRLLEERQLIHHQGSGRYKLTVGGVEEFERISSGRAQFDQGFVAMWFGEELGSVYERGFKAAILEAGYQPMRIDKKEHNNKIDDEIIAEIRRSRFLIADMTSPVCQIDGQETAIVRGGVYYEAGFAHGLGMPVIWTARNGMAAHFHLDTRQYPHIMWKDADDLRQQLKARIGAVLGYGPRAR